MRACGDLLLGPARLRWQLRAALQEAGASYHDEVAAQLATEQLATEQSSRFVGAEANDVATAHADSSPWLGTLRQSGYRGLLVGLCDSDRMYLLQSLRETLNQRVLLVVADSAVEHRWHQVLMRQQLSRFCRVHTVRHAAERMHWLGCRHDVLVVDAPELLPRCSLEAVVEQSAALARIGFCGRADGQQLLRLSPGLGPVLGVSNSHEQPRCQQIRVPMPAAHAHAYAAAWSTFLSAYDRWAATRGDAGFGTFVAQARNDTLQRPALRAWHEAVRLAAWHPHKATQVAELLQRHPYDRLLLFTPDRQSAYELARDHLLAAITSEIPPRERRALLTAFANGSVRALAGPRLLDAGVTERSADVGILIGGGFGKDQRMARSRRIHTSGMIYELVSQETLEVGRAHRWRQSDTDAAAVVHPG